MSRRQRAIELLAAAGLAPQELAIEREKSGREGRARSDILGALSALIPAGANLAGTLDGIDQDKAARALRADHAKEASHMVNQPH